MIAIITENNAYIVIPTSHSEIIRLRRKRHRRNGIRRGVCHFDILLGRSRCGRRCCRGATKERHRSTFFYVFSARALSLDQDVVLQCSEIELRRKEGISNRRRWLEVARLETRVQVRRIWVCHKRRCQQQRAKAGCCWCQHRRGGALAIYSNSIHNLKAMRAFAVRHIMSCDRCRIRPYVVRYSY